MKLDVKPGDPLWYRFLTASRWASAIGVGPESRTNIYLDMTKGPNWRRQYDVTNPAIEWGKNNEMAGIAWFQKNVGPVTPNDKLYIASEPPEAPYVLGATPDAIAPDYGVEVKCPYNTSGYNGPTLHHIIQAYACAWVLNVPRWYLVYWYPHQVYTYVITNDAKAFTIIKPFILEFIHYVHSGQQPPNFARNEKKAREIVVSSTFNALTKRLA